MESNSGNKLDKLSTLSAWLIKVEREHLKCADGAEVDARQNLVDALGQFNSSRYRFGKALAIYKEFFMEAGGWMDTANLIGHAIGRDERTIRRIIIDYQRASEVPVEAIEELEARGFDPAAKKNAPVLANILEMPTAVVKSNPKEAVAHAVKTAKAEKATTAKKPIQSVPVTAEGTPVSAPLTREEKQRFAIRLKIRAAWASIPDDKKLEELFAALMEEMHDALGMRDAIDITLTPRLSALTLDGRRKLEDAA